MVSIRFALNPSRKLLNPAECGSLLAVFCEFKMLSQLTSKPGRVFTRQQVIERIWEEYRIITPKTNASSSSFFVLRNYPYNIMRNIKLTIEYDGTNYQGWQIQPNVPTIQDTIQKALAKITKIEVNLIGAGRTDAGVHAKGQVANFHTESKMPTPAFQKALNSVLPGDIVMLKSEEVSHDFHARYSAISRIYKYTILNSDCPSVFIRNLAYFLPNKLDVVKMAQMCKILVGTHDFSSFQRTGSSRKNPVCTVKDARCWVEECYASHLNTDKVRLVCIQFEADSFLRGMVRAIVGTLLKLNSEETAVSKMTEILRTRDRSAAGASAPAHGLSLMEVRY